MKICIISPASHLDEYSNLGDCEMALSHLVVPDIGFNHTPYVQENYVRYYKQKSAEGKWVILDNSAYEIGKLEATHANGGGLGPEIVLRAAEMIKPSIVIAQDILTDREATLESTKAFIKYVEKKGLLGNFQIMAVAQGKTQDEWLGSYEDMLKLDKVDQIGFSKIAVPLSFGGNQAEDGCVAKARLKATKVVDEMFEYPSWTSPKPAHLLGGDNWLPWELEQQKQYDWVFSNDSSATVWYGVHEETYDPTTGKIQSIITDKPDLENGRKSTGKKLEACSAEILYNIAVLHKFSK